MKSYILYMESDGIAKLKDPHNLYFTVQHTDSHLLFYYQQNRSGMAGKHNY